MTILSIKCFREPSFVGISETKVPTQLLSIASQFDCQQKGFQNKGGILYQQNVIAMSA